LRGDSPPMASPTGEAIERLERYPLLSVAPVRLEIDSMEIDGHLQLPKCGLFG
jgi:hypothetical protein